MKKLLPLLLLLAACASPTPINSDSLTVEVYWASYCPACAQQLIVLDDVSRAFADNPILSERVEFVAACLDLSPEELQAVMQEAGYIFRMTSGEELPYWSNGIPSVLIRDASGTAVYKRIGYIDQAELSALIMNLLGFEAI